MDMKNYFIWEVAAMFSSYQENDVTILLKDISGLVTPLATKEREALIQSGIHYSEMLPLEYEPSPEYLAIYQTALQRYAKLTADAVAAVSELIWAEKGAETTLVSLARAGTSIGILIKRYLQFRFHTDVAHYTISIIRQKGIDQNAMNYILRRHKPESIQFVDGWTGKGAIQRELNQAMKYYPHINPGLAVLSDPAHIAGKCGTHEDFLIASSCLNATVSGLLSRTFYRKDIIQENDFHGAAYYSNLLPQDCTYQFIDAIQKNFPITQMAIPEQSLYIPEHTEFNIDIPARTGMDEVYEICTHFQIPDIHLVKPSIGETTRVLLRRVPWKILVHSLDDWKHLGPIYQLAAEKGVEVTEYPLKHYKACGLIRKLADN